MRLLGIIPAAGLGSRLQPLPFSKELYPVGIRMIDNSLRVTPIAFHLIDAFKQAEVSQLYFVVGPQKTDIPRYFLNGSQFGVQFSYLYQPKPKGMVDALAQVTPWLQADEEALVFIGMPDTYFQPSNLFMKMKEAMLRNPELHVVLGIFPASSWWKLGMVHFRLQEDGTGEVIDIEDKPKVRPTTNYAWGTAVWRIRFQRYLTRCQAEYEGENELVLSDVLLNAKRDGMKVGCIVGSEYEDLGTLDDLIRFTKRIVKGEEEDQ